MRRRACRLLSSAATPIHAPRNAFTDWAPTHISRSLTRPRRYAKNWSSFSMDISLRTLPKRRFTRATHFNILSKACWLWLPFVVAVGATGQTQAPATATEAGPLNEILRRLTRLEEQNQQLLEEVHQLRSALAQSRGAPEAASAQESESVQSIEEKIDVQERRIEEQAQTKVESSEHLPLRITGMALFSASLHSRQTGGLTETTTAPPSGRALVGGATLRQSIVGFEFRGPETIWGGKI